MHSKQKNASSTSNLYTLRMADNLLCFSNRSYKNSHKTLLYLLVYLLLIFKSGMQLLLSSGYFSSVVAIISQFMYSKVNIAIIATLHFKEMKDLNDTLRKCNSHPVLVFAASPLRNITLFCQLILKLSRLELLSLLQIFIFCCYSRYIQIAL